MGVGPQPRPITSTGTYRKRCDNLGIYRFPEINDALPLLPAQNTHESWRWCARRRIGVREVRGVGPCTADAHVRRSQCCRELAEPGVGQINGRTVLVEAWIHAYRRVAIRSTRGRLTSLEDRVELRSV